MKKQSKLGKINISKITAIFLAVALFCFVITGTVSLAKYINKKQNIEYIESGNFYFASNILKEDSGKSYALSMGTTSISFDLSNTEDNLRFSGVDIDYTITVTGGAIISKNSGTLAKNTNSTEIITLSGMTNGGTYTVTAIGNAGYELILKATFTIGTEKNGFFMNVDNSNDAFVLLTLWTENIKGNVDITIPAGLIPDNTDSVMSTITNYNSETSKYESITFEDNESFVNNYSSYTYRFFKTEDYTGEEFIVKINDTIIATNGVID